jgi:hypothetical protein
MAMHFGTLNSTLVTLALWTGVHVYGREVGVAVSPGASPRADTTAPAQPRLVSDSTPRGNLEQDSAGHARLSGVASARPRDTTDYRHQVDLTDLFLIVLHKDPSKRVADPQAQKNRVYVSAAPAIQYATSTGLGVNLTGNVAFYLAKDSITNLSSALMSIAVTQNKQLIVPLQSSLWTKNNKYNFVGDWRFLAFPEKTYGLGGTTSLDDGYDLDYNYVRFYQFVLRKIAKDFYIGPGYTLDIHYNIEQLGLPPGKVTDFDTYGFSPTSHSSGIALDFLYDTRKNSINPDGGSFYGNLVLRQNLTALGSDQNWSSLLLDVRKYFRFPGHSNNVLAFWSYDWLTLSGHPPYLDLPSTGWDTYDNTGRGYIQSRFRSNNMLDLEGEYRFGILRDGLIGGVVFGNAQSYSDLGTGKFSTVWPGVGAGLRIKFNKFSKTNVCIDYALGIKGNQGLFLNLGEVF